MPWRIVGGNGNTLRLFVFICFYAKVYLSMVNSWKDGKCHAVMGGTKIDWLCDLWPICTKSYYNKYYIILYYRRSSRQCFTNLFTVNGNHIKNWKIQFQWYINGYLKKLLLQTFLEFNNKIFKRYFFTKIRQLASGYS